MLKDKSDPKLEVTWEYTPGPDSAERVRQAYRFLFEVVRRRGTTARESVQHGKQPR